MKGFTYRSIAVTAFCVAGITPASAELDVHACLVSSLDTPASNDDQEVVLRNVTTSYSKRLAEERARQSETLLRVSKMLEALEKGGYRARLIGAAEWEMADVRRIVRLYHPGERVILGAIAGSRGKDAQGRSVRALRSEAKGWLKEALEIQVDGQPLLTREGRLLALRSPAEFFQALPKLWNDLLTETGQWHLISELQKRNPVAFLDFKEWRRKEGAPAMLGRSLTPERTPGVFEVGTLMAEEQSPAELAEKLRLAFEELGVAPQQLHFIFKKDKLASPEKADAWLQQISLGVTLEFPAYTTDHEGIGFTLLQHGYHLPVIDPSDPAYFGKGDLRFKRTRFDGPDADSLMSLEVRGTSLAHFRGLKAFLSVVGDDSATGPAKWDFRPPFPESAWGSFVDAIGVDKRTKLRVPGAHAAFEVPGSSTVVQTIKVGLSNPKLMADPALAPFKARGLQPDKMAIPAYPWEILFPDAASIFKAARAKYIRSLRNAASVEELGRAYAAWMRETEVVRRYREVAFASQGPEQVSN